VRGISTCEIVSLDYQKVADHCLSLLWSDIMLTLHEQKVPDLLQAAYNGIAQADMVQDFRYVRLERHEQEIEAQTRTRTIC
jgi:hypothetical protein